MTLRRRLTLLAAGSVALAICLASVVVYIAVRSELRGQTDDGLRAQAAVASERAPQIAAGAAGLVPRTCWCHRAAPRRPARRGRSSSSA